MNINKSFIFLFLSFFASISVFTQNKIDNTFIFPIDVTPKVSGSFGELRGNHFHSGLDISTQGKIGIDVKSAEDGKVSRIKVSPVGYGNAVYIEHENGYTTVYGHLNAYSDKIKKIITEQQYKKKSFSIDYFPEDDIKVSKGEVIGYSGNTGSSGGPHLHYEVRDTKSEEPMNPFLFQSKVSDNINPTIIGARIYALDGDSYVNGGKKTAMYPAVKYDGKYNLKGKPSIKTKGNIGIAIRMVDYVNGSWAKCGVTHLKMFNNNNLVYEWDLNRFSFYETRYINSHIDYSYKNYSGRKYEKCFKDPNNKLSIYKNVVNNGIIKVTGKSAIRIEVNDAAGNTSILNFTINEDTRTYPTTPESNKGELVKYNQNKTLTTSDGATCAIPSLSMYKNNYIEVIKSSKKASNGNAIYTFGSYDIPLQKAVEIKVPYSTETETDKLCLARVTSKGSLIYEGGKFNNGYITLKTRTFGNYTVTTDKTKPNIKLLNPTTGYNYSKSKKIRFKITDNFSGIKKYNAYVDGEWYMLEQDAKTSTFWCDFTKKPLSSGKHKLKIVVSDSCDNNSSKEMNIVL